MLGDWIAWQRAVLQPLGPFGAWLGSGLDALAPPARALEPTLRRLLGTGLEVSTLAETPFARTSRFGITGRRAAAQVLIPAHSGYAPAVLWPLAATILEQHDLVVPEWRDARSVPLAAGTFDLAAQTGHVLEACAAAGDEAAIVAVSQGGIAAVRAALLTGCQRRLVLLGAPLHPRAGSLGLLSWALAASRCGFAFPRVPPSHPGADRAVYPGAAQLLAVIASAPLDYWQLRLGLLLELAGWAELALDGLAYLAARDEGELRATLGVAASSARLELLTVEAGEDALVPAGQTHGAGPLLGACLERQRRLDLPGARHHELFTGVPFNEAVRPALLRFLR